MNRGRPQLYRGKPGRRRLVDRIKMFNTNGANREGCQNSGRTGATPGQTMIPPGLDPDELG